MVVDSVCYENLRLTGLVHSSPEADPIAYKDDCVILPGRTRRKTCRSSDRRGKQFRQGIPDSIMNSYVLYQFIHM
jgi:hypothetical protein